MRLSYVCELPWSGRRSSTAARAHSALLLLPAPRAPAAPAAAPSGTGGTAAGTTWPRPPGPARSGDGDQKLANVVATETFFHGGKLNCLCRGRRWGRLSSLGVFNGMYHVRIMFSFTCFCFRDEIPIYHGSFVPSLSMEYASRVSPTSIMHACITLTTAAECRLTHLVWFCGIIFKTLL